MCFVRANRPMQRRIFNCNANNSSTRLDILPSGVVTVVRQGGTEGIYLLIRLLSEYLGCNSSHWNILVKPAITKKRIFK